MTNSQPKLKIFICESCGHEFKRYAGQRPKAHIYCSLKCSGQNSHIRAKRPVQRYHYQCEWCNKEFESEKPRNHARIYCSLSCGAKARQERWRQERIKNMDIDPCVIPKATPRMMVVLDENELKNI